MFFGILLLLATYYTQGFKETEITEFQGSLTSIPIAKFSNVSSHNNSYILRDEKGNSSTLTFMPLNPKDEWSAEFYFQVPQLKFPEKVSIFFWYTNDKLEEGEFFGASDLFSGIMTGLEFHEKTIDLILASGDGEVIDEEMILRDSTHIKHAEHLKFKLIYTKKNLKVEIYDKTELIYDSLRFYDTEVLGHLGANKHFSITTNYYNVPLNKHFILDDIKVYSREEDETYNPHQKNVSHEDNVDHEIEHAISNMEHLMVYLDHVIGKPNGYTIISSILGISKDIKKEKEKLNSFVNKIEKNGSLGEISSKISKMEVELQNAIRIMNNLKYYLKDFEQDHEKNSNWAILAVIIGVIFIVLLYVFKSDTKVKEN